MGHLESELASAAHLIREGGRLLPGIPDVLDRLEARGVLQSVLTGNLAANAAIKLAAFDLDRWLDLEIGAFGSDDADRTRLVPVALERVRRRRQTDLSPHDVWIVGDTPNDLACAQAGEARCLLVATGRIPRSELEGLGADAVLDDLSDVERAVALLTS